METPLVSAIIPLYNARPFVEECILSIQHQTYKNIEIIVVNDGSTDGSEEVVAALQKQYPNITLVHQSNAGVGAARNKGMEYAKGEYITFVDSDDFLDALAIEQAVSACVKYDAAATFYNMVHHTPAGNTELAYPIHLYKRYEECISPAEDDRCMHFINTAFLINRAFMNHNNIRYVAGLWFEDRELVSQIYARAEKVVLLSGGLYYYRKKFGRAQITTDPRRYVDVFHSYQKAKLNLKLRPNLHLRNDLTFLVHALACYKRLMRQRNIALRLEYLALFKTTIATFSESYIAELYTGMNRMEKRRWRKMLRYLRFSFLLKFRYLVQKYVFRQSQ